MSDAPKVTPVDIRWRAIEIAVAARRDIFRLTKDDTEDIVATVLDDARRYAEWIEFGEPATT